MDTLSVGAGKYVESDLVDIGTLSLGARQCWEGTAIRAAIRVAVLDALPVYVCEQQAYNDWTI